MDILVYVSYLKSKLENAKEMPVRRSILGSKNVWLEEGGWAKKMSDISDWYQTQLGLSRLVP